MSQVMNEILSYGKQIANMILSLRVLTGVHPTFKPLE